MQGMYIVDKLLCTRFRRRSRTRSLLVHVVVAGIMSAGDVEKQLLSLQQEEEEFMHVVAAGAAFR
jgi:hypothetical protein